MAITTAFPRLSALLRTFNMKLSNQVVSLDIAKRLKELGVKREGFFRWVQLVNEPGDEKPWISESHYFLGDKKCEFIASAYTVAELGEMLGQFSAWRDGNGRYGIRNESESGRHTEIEDTEADARGNLLIYLLEQGLTKAKEL